MRGVDVSALFAAAILRRKPDSVVVPFDGRTHDVHVEFVLPQDAKDDTRLPKSVEARDR
jgi:hypothetical protein